MLKVALRMLTGDRAKYLGLIFGISFATLLMSQQVSIFIGILSRTASQIIDISEPDIWVMDPQVQYIDEPKALSSFDILRVKGVEGVKWAVPFFKAMASIRTFGGKMQQVSLLGVDDDSLVGQPPKMILGNWQDIKNPNAIIMDRGGWEFIWGDEPYEIGREVEINDKKARIVGICEASPPFATFPIVYTRFSNSSKYIPLGRNNVSFILAKSQDNKNLSEVMNNITKKTGLQALSAEQFKWRSINHYLNKTGIAINFGITVTLGFIVGATIAAQTFYIFVIENMKQFGALKAIGVSNRQIVNMVLIQCLVVGIVGFSIGIGLAALFFEATSNLTPMRGFYLRPIVVLGAAVTVFVIMSLASLISIRKVLVLDPAIVFRG